MTFILLQKRKNPTVVDAGDLGASGIKCQFLSDLLLWLSQNQLATECRFSGNSRYGGSNPFIVTLNSQLIFF